MIALFVNRGDTPGTGRHVFASNRKNTENASRSTPPRSEQMSSVNGLGSMSRRRWTRYVVVPRLRASASIAVFGRRNDVTSAMCTPSSSCPVSAPSSSSTRTRHDNASSMSRQPGGSTEHTRSDRKSSRCGCAPKCARSSNAHGSGGTHACTAGANSRSSTSASRSTASVSASASPSGPRLLT